MDERQTQIKEGAGLEESRINEELLDFLNKWSTPILMGIVVIAAGWWGYQQFQRAKVAKVNEAFGQFAAVEGSANASPTSLTALAEEYEGVRSVSELARLRAGDVYLNAVLRGLQPGAELIPGTEPAEAEVLTQDDRVDMLSRAERAYAAVLASTADDTAKALLGFNAAMGLAAVEENRGDAEKARGHYETAKRLLEAGGYDGMQGLIDARVEALAELPALVTLPAEADLPPLPGQEIPEIVAPEIELPEPGPIGPTEEQTGELVVPAETESSDGDPVEAPVETPAESTPDEPAESTGSADDE